MTVGDLIIELMEFDTAKNVKVALTDDGQEELNISRIDKNHEDGGPLIIYYLS